MIVRSLTAEGIDRFRGYLINLTDDPKLGPPLDLLGDPAVTKFVKGDATVEAQPFSDKLAAGKYLNSALNSISSQNLEKDMGIWAWLTLFYFEQVCPKDGRGNRIRLSLEKYLPETSNHFLGPDKHLLFMPWKMYKLHGEVSRYMLMHPLRSDSRIMREWTGYNYNVSSSLIRLGEALYFDLQKDCLKKGAATNARSLTRILNQFNVTYDIWNMKTDELIALLPRNQFRRFIPRSRA